MVLLNHAWSSKFVNLINTISQSIQAYKQIALSISLKFNQLKNHTILYINNSNYNLNVENSHTIIDISKII